MNYQALEVRDCRTKAEMISAYRWARRRLNPIPQQTANPRPLPAPMPIAHDIGEREKASTIMAAILTLTPAEEVKIPAGQIIAAVAAAHGFPIAELKGQRRSPGIIGARWHAIALLIKARPDLSFCVIGALMNRDHSTIIYARRHWPAIANNYRPQMAKVLDLAGIE